MELHGERGGESGSPRVGGGGAGERAVASANPRERRKQRLARVRSEARIGGRLVAVLICADVLARVGDPGQVLITLVLFGLLIRFGATWARCLVAVRFILSGSQLAFCGMSAAAGSNACGLDPAIGWLAIALGAAFAAGGGLISFSDSVRLYCDERRRAATWSPRRKAGTLVR